MKGAEKGHVDYMEEFDDYYNKSRPEREKKGTVYTINNTWFANTSHRTIGP